MKLYSTQLFSPRKSALLTLCLGVFALAAQAQNWPEPGASWEYCLHPPTVWDTEGTKTYAYTADTTISGMSYAIIRHISTNDEVFEAGTAWDYNNRVYLRSDGDTIFRNVQGVDHIFFINGLELGDTYTTFRTALNNYNTYSCNPEIHLEVIEVSNIEIAGETYREVLLDDTNFTDVYDDNFSDHLDVNPKYAFVEGVGLRNDFPFVFHLGYDAQSSGGEECYLSTDGMGEITLNKYHSDNQFIDFDECFSVSVAEHHAPRLSIFPNPISDRFQIESPENRTIGSITAYDLQGRIVKSLNPQDQFHSFGNLPTGMYVLQLETADGLVWKKVVKE